jgi:hypothetical protein
LFSTTALGEKRMTLAVGLEDGVAKAVGVAARGLARQAATPRSDVNAGEALNRSYVIVRDLDDRILAANPKTN